jgi:hypothetical protein
MQPIIQHIKTAPILKLIIYCIAIAHVLFLADAINSFGIGFTEDVHWRTWVIAVFTILYICACSDNRFFYYAYIGSAIASMLLVFAIKDYTFYLTVFRALFPMHLLFAGVLILDLQRVIFLAHRNRSAQ